MESLLINAIIGLWLIGFGAMALFPLLLDTRSGTTTRVTPAEDQVISIQPVATRHQLATIEPVADQPVAAGAPVTPASTHPVHRHAA